MLIDCPSCRKSYPIVNTLLGSAGRRVACPRCEAAWFVTQDTEDVATAAADQAASHPIKIAIGAADRALHRAETVSPPGPSAEFPSSQLSFAPTVAAARRQRPPSTLAEICTALTLVTLMMAGIGLRAEIIQLWPRAAIAYATLGLPINLRGLALENFHTRTTSDGFQTVLGIEGEIENLRPQTTKIPPIQFAIRDDQGRVLYSWRVAAPRQNLAPKETYAFRARLAAPPAGARTLLVRFTSTAPWSLASAWQKAALHF